MGFWTAERLITGFKMEMAVRIGKPKAVSEMAERMELPEVSRNALLIKTHRNAFGIAACFRGLMFAYESGHMRQAKLLERRNIFIQGGKVAEVSHVEY